MTIADNLTRIKNATDNIREIVDACVGVETTDKVETYPNKLASAIVDTPSEQVVMQRSLSGIKDGVAYVDKVKGNTLVWNQLCSEVGGFGDGGIVYGVKREKISNLKVRYSGNATTTTSYTITQFEFLKGNKYLNRLLGSVRNFENCTISATSSSSRFGKYEAITYYSVNATGGFGVYITSGYDFDFEAIPQIINLTQMFGAGNEPTTADEFANRLGYATIDDVPYFDYNEGTLLSFNGTAIQSKDEASEVISTLPLNISTILNTDGTKLFPNGLCSAGNVYDEITPTKATKRVSDVVSSDGNSYEVLETPIEVDLTERKHYYKVENGGSESIVADALTTPLRADIGYRSAMSAEELVTTLNETLNS